MSLLGRIKARSGVGRKQWTEPDFWSLEAARVANWWAGSGLSGDKEHIENDFEGYVQGAFKRNGAVFAAMLARHMVFTEARFQWRRYEKGRPTDLFGDASLALLENPWPSGTTGELLGRMLQDADLAGNFYGTTADDNGRLGAAATGPGRRISRLRPDWVDIILGSHSGDLKAPDTRVIGYLYKPPGGTSPEVLLLPSEVCHFSPIPDPIAHFRGMSWLTPVIREIEADTAATLHKKKFFDNAAVPNLAIKFDRDTDEAEFDEFVETFKEKHQGAWNAYKTLFLLGGADVTPLSHDFRQLEFNATQSKGEDRILAAAGVPPAWVGLGGGNQGAGLNSQGVYAAARRRFADGTIRPLWRMASASLQVLVEDGRPGGAALWFDDRDIAFLREDAKDRAEIFQVVMHALNTGIQSGWEPDALIAATRDYDINQLVGKHTGMMSVQMQEPHRQETEAERDKADLLQVQADTLTVLVASGYFTEESAIAAVQAADLTLLKPKPQSTTAPPSELVGMPSGHRVPVQPQPPSTGNDVPGGGQ